MNNQVKLAMATTRTRSVEAVNSQASLPICFLLVVILSLFFPRYTAGQDQLPLSEQLVGNQFSYVIQKGDSLTGIGARFGVGTGTLVANNNLSPSSLLKVGQQLRVDNRHIVPNIVKEGIVINIPQRMLFYFKDGRLLHFFPVGLGRHDWPTPVGRFQIVVKEENPVWDVP